MFDTIYLQSVVFFIIVVICFVPHHRVYFVAIQNRAFFVRFVSRGRRISTLRFFPRYTDTPFKNCWRGDCEKKGERARGDRRETFLSLVWSRKPRMVSGLPIRGAEKCDRRKADLVVERAKLIHHHHHRHFRARLHHHHRRLYHLQLQRELWPTTIARLGDREQREWWWPRDIAPTLPSLLPLC